MSRLRVLLIRSWKPVLALAILALVARHFIRILSRPELDPYPFSLRVQWLIPAGLLYLGAHSIWAWFWVRLLRSQGVAVRYREGARAYFVSQIGKYIPGKVAVIAIRIALLRRPDRAKSLAVGITATYETLTSMGAGALVGVLLLPWVEVMPPELSDNIALIAAVAALPAALGVLNKVAARRIAKLRGPDATPLPSPPLTLLAQGLLHGAAGWCLLGVSLALTVQAVATDPPPWSVDMYLGNLGAMALGYVSGFFVLLTPSGLGIREVILQYALMPRFEPALGESLAAAQAAVIALVLRLTWTIAEFIAIPCLYFLLPPTAPSEPTS